jgi:hypothetical protein
VATTRSAGEAGPIASDSTACAAALRPSQGGDDVLNVAEGCAYQGGDLPPPKEVGDYVDCGPGRDVVRNVGRGDEIAEDCERKTKEGLRF